MFHYMYKKRYICCGIILTLYLVTVDIWGVVTYNVSIYILICLFLQCYTRKLVIS